MRVFPVFRNSSAKGQLLLLLGLIILGTLFSIILASGVSLLIWGPGVLTTMSRPEGMNINFMRTFQMINQVGIFIVPPLLFARLTQIKGFQFLGIRKASSLHFISAILIILLAGPMINYLVEWNEQLRLPEYLKSIEQWMQNSEESAARLTEQLLNTAKIIDMVINLLMIGILPAIGEELLFRSALIGILRKMFRNIHWPVIISAVIFSAFHLQFYGFFPRFVLGLMLGYLFVYSGSVWVPALAHLVNNGTVVLVSWLMANHYIAGKPEDLPVFGSWTAVLTSALFVIMILVWIYRTRKPEPIDVNEGLTG